MAKADFLIESLEGPVTAAEISAFKQGMAALEPGASNHGNNFAYGNGGKNCEALGNMFAVAQDSAMLDRMIHFADEMLAVRNDLSEQRAIWTGKAEKCWPNKSSTDADAAYCGTENGDVVGHIVYAATLILHTPALFDMEVPDGDPRQHGKTYLDRARTYVKAGDDVVDALLLPYFVDPASKHFRLPTGDGWNALGDRYKKDAGKGVPWNQQMMLLGAFQHLAEAHELLADAPQRVESYDAIAKAALDWFASSLVSSTVNGKACVKWSYATGDATLHYMEDVGHGGYDVWGIWRGSQRARYMVSDATMNALANTVHYVLAGSDGTFAARVDGGGSRKKSLGSTYLYLAQFDADLLPLLANADLLKQAKTRADVTARILWLKHLLNGGFAPPGEQTDGGAAGDDAGAMKPPLASDAGNSDAGGVAMMPGDAGLGDAGTMQMAEPEAEDASMSEGPESGQPAKPARPHTSGCTSAPAGSRTPALFFATVIGMSLLVRRRRR